MGAVEETDSTVILDVGGDPSGCRTLARYVKKIKERGYEMHLVINTNRPFTSNEAEIKAMLIMLEATANLEVTDLICNTNLMEFTDEKVVEKGIRIINNFAAKEELKFENYLVLDKFQDLIPDNIAGKTRIVMEYFLSKPWEKVISNSI
jgi:ribonuclease HI